MPPEARPPAPSAADFDQAFSTSASPRIRRVWELAEPGLPAEVEPFSFVSPGLLRHVLQATDLAPGQTLADLGCGRGGPGLWLAREAGALLVGVDFSPVAVEQAADRATLFGLADRARFAVGDFTRTGLPTATADAAVSVDAFHFAANPAAAAAEARRILRPGRRLVLTNWQPNVPGDSRLPPRARIDWPSLLRGAGFTGVEMEARPEWHDTYTRVYQAALSLGDPGDDTLLADLQDEARQRLPLAGLQERIVVIATAPGQARVPTRGTDGHVPHTAGVRDADLVITVMPPASAAAGEVLRAYFAEVASRYYGRPATEEEIAAAMREEPSDDLSPPGGLLLVAVQDGAVLGCAGLRLLPGGIGEVTRVYVMPAARRRGLGSRLLDELETHARDHRVTRLRLDTRRDLVEARQLYARHGYRETTPFSRGPYSDHWFQKDLLGGKPGPFGT